MIIIDLPGSEIRHFIKSCDLFETINVNEHDKPSDFFIYL